MREVNYILDGLYLKNLVAVSSKHMYQTYKVTL